MSKPLINKTKSGIVPRELSLALAEAEAEIQGYKDL